MKTPLLLTVLLMLSVALTASAQNEAQFRFLKQHGGGITDFEVDNLGNLFLLHSNGQLKKLTPEGDSLAVFNNVRRFGRAAAIDVSNPLKILLYYRAFGTIVILDRFLNERTTIDLRRQQFPQVRAVGQAYDNNIWIYDELELKLKKIGDDGRLIDQSNDFRLIFDSVPAPQKIIDENKRVYLYDTAKGVYIFDYFGGFQMRLPFTGWSDVRVFNNSLFGRNDNYLFRYDLGSLQLQQIKLPLFAKDSEKIVVAPGLVYVLRGGVIMVYSYS